MFYSNFSLLLTVFFFETGGGRVTVGFRRGVFIAGSLNVPAAAQEPQRQKETRSTNTGRNLTFVRSLKGNVQTNKQAEESKKNVLLHQIIQQIQRQTVYDCDDRGSCDLNVQTHPTATPWQPELSHGSFVVPVG